MSVAEDVVGEPSAESRSDERRSNDFGRIRIERVCDLQVRREHELDSAEIWWSKAANQCTEDLIECRIPGIEWHCRRVEGIAFERSGEEVIKQDALIGQIFEFRCTSTQKPTGGERSVIFSWELFNEFRDYQGPQRLSI